MGGAQPLAASMAGASLLAIECRPSSIEFRLRTGYVDVQAKDLDDALAIIERSTKARKAVSVALLGNAGEVLPELLRRGVRPDIVTDQTSAHDPINGYHAQGMEPAAMGRIGARAIPRGLSAPPQASMGEHVRAMLAFAHAGRPDRRTMATTSARWRSKTASRTHSTSRASCPPISARCSVAESARSGGRRCRAIRRTFSGLTPRSRR